MGKILIKGAKFFTLNGQNSLRFCFESKRTIPVVHEESYCIHFTDASKILMDASKIRQDRVIVLCRHT